MSMHSSPSSAPSSHEFTVPIGIEVQVGGQTKIYDLVVKSRNPSGSGRLPEDQIRMIKAIVQKTFEAYGIQQHGHGLTAEHMSRIFREIKLIKGSAGNTIKDGENEPIDASTVGIHETEGRRLHALTAGESLWPMPRGPETVSDTINGLHQLLFNRRAHVSGSTYSAEPQVTRDTVHELRDELGSLHGSIPDRDRVIDLDLESLPGTEDEWEPPLPTVGSRSAPLSPSHLSPSREHSRDEVHDLELSPSPSPRTTPVSTASQSGGWGWPRSWGATRQESAPVTHSLPRDREEVFDLVDLESAPSHSHRSVLERDRDSDRSSTTGSQTSFVTPPSHVSAHASPSSPALIRERGIVGMPLPESGGYQAFAPADPDNTLLQGVHLFQLLPYNAIQDPYPNGIVEGTPAYLAAQERLRTIFRIFQKSTAMDQKTAEFWAFLKAEVNKYQRDPFAAALALDRIFRGFKVYGADENHGRLLQAQLSS